MIMLPVFFVLVKPASTIAKPACIQNTNAAPIRNQTANTSVVVASLTNALIASSIFKMPPLRFWGLPHAEHRRVERNAIGRLRYAYQCLSGGCGLSIR